ncbi:MAG: endolytic transglycosylase MltG [Polyangiaceae bacterium]
MTTKKRAPRRRLVMAVGLVALGLVAGAAITLGLVYRWFVARPGPAGEGPVAVAWPEGLEPREAAELLADLGLTDEPAAMALYLRATKALDCAVPGPHYLPAGTTPADLVAALCRKPDRPTVKVTIVEGFHRYQIAHRLAAKGIVSEQAFLRSSADATRLYKLGIEPSTHPQADTAEGFLFPATYELAIDSDPEAVVTRLVQEGMRRLDRAIEKHPEGFAALGEIGFDRRDVMTLASMVEKEAALAEERPMIASVFLNRLRSDAFPHLQSDPTAVYGCYAMPEQIPACEGFTGRATGGINRDRANVFSTYVTPGLPPGPIANPGDAAIEAVLAPAETSYFYFVAKGGGRHDFTEDYAAHNAAVDRLRKQRAAPDVPPPP